MSTSHRDQSSNSQTEVLNDFFNSQQQISQNIAELNKCILNNPQDASSLNTRAIIFTRMSSYIQAEKDFSTAITIDPLNVDYYYNRALMYMQIGKMNLEALENAIADLNKAIAFKIKNKEKTALFYAARAECHVKLGRRQNAYDDVKEAATLYYVHSRLFNFLNLNDLANK